MRHIKELVLESKKLNPYEKYQSIIANELHEHTFNVEKNKLQVYQDLEGEICVKVKTIGGLNKRNLGYCQKYFGSEWLYYVIEPANGRQMWVTFYDIPKEFFEKLDLEMKTNKFNV